MDWLAVSILTSTRRLAGWLAGCLPICLLILHSGKCKRLRPCFRCIGRRNTFFYFGTICLFIFLARWINLKNRTCLETEKSRSDSNPEKHLEVDRNHRTESGLETQKNYLLEQNPESESRGKIDVVETWAWWKNIYWSRSQFSNFTRAAVSVQAPILASVLEPPLPFLVPIDLSRACSSFSVLSRMTVAGAKIMFLMELRLETDIKHFLPRLNQSRSLMRIIVRSCSREKIVYWNQFQELQSEPKLNSDFSGASSELLRLWVLIKTLNLKSSVDRIRGRSFR